MISMLTPNPEAASINEAVERYLSEGGKIDTVATGQQVSDGSLYISPTMRQKANAVKERRNMMFFQGEMRARKDIAKMVGIPWQTIKSRIGHGKTLEEAVSMPYQPNKAAP